MTQPTDEQRAQELAQEVFSKCFLVMLAHVQRRIAQDPEYEEPRFLRAFLMAFEAVHKPDAKDGQNYMGVSTSENPAEAYAVVLGKRGSGIEILELKDIVRNKTVGEREIMRLMQMSILLDNIPAESVEWARTLEILNGSVPGIRVVKFPNNQWKKYRTKFIAEIWAGKLPRVNSNDPEVQRLRSAASFADVPQHFRSYVGALYASEKYPGGKTMSITSPDKTVDKKRIFEIAKELIYGYGAEYMDPMDLPESK